MRMPISGWLLVGAIILSAATTLPTESGFVIEATSVALMVSAVLRAHHEGRTKGRHDG